jgi:aspartate aminotransferase
MFPPGTPKPVQRAHTQIIPIYDFLATYERWVAEGGDTYCDFALGNPQTMPMPEFVTALREAATPRNRTWYAYKMNEPESRVIVRQTLKSLTGLDYPPENIFMTNGATGALLVVMNALIGPDDEVIVNSPPWFFYEGMILQRGGTPVVISVDPETFDPDLGAMERAITERTRFVILNSPNNPTGRVYAPDVLRKISGILETASKRIGRPIYLVSDEAYRKVVYDGATFHSPTKFYKNSIMVYSYGKTLLTPGQRIGYIALSPEMDHLEELRTIMLSSQILSGWAMTSALMQHSLRDLEGISVDVAGLQKRRDRFVTGLRDCGYEVRSPEGAFYIMPRTPIEDDVVFADILAKDGVFCLPGSVVHMKGYLRASVTGTDEMVERALPVFAAAREKALAVAG